MLGVTGADSAFFEGKFGALPAFEGGGGDLTLGGLPLGWACPLRPFPNLWGLEASPLVSWDTVGCNCGVPATDKALCIAAAEGIVGMLEPAILDARFGLRSWLLFLERVVLEFAEMLGLS